MSEHELDILLYGQAADTRRLASPNIVGYPSLEADLDSLLVSPRKKQDEPPTRAEQREEAREASRRELKRQGRELTEEVIALRGKFQRAHQLNWVMLVACGALLLGMGGTYLYARMNTARALEQAFRIIHYREERALSANAITLEEWSKRIENLISKVAQREGIPDDERQERFKTLTALKSQAESLRDGFLKQLAVNEKERNVGGGFSYRDPFLKKEVSLNEANGGMIDLNALKEEIRKNANLDATMVNLEEAMLNPIPLHEQVRQQASLERKDSNLASVDLTKGLAKAKGEPGAAVFPMVNP